MNFLRLLETIRRLSGNPEVRALFSELLQEARRADDPWRIVGVDPDDPPELIREVYLTKMKHYHPDRGGNPHKAARLTEAYRRISDGRR